MTILGDNLYKDSLVSSYLDHDRTSVQLFTMFRMKKRGLPLSIRYIVKRLDKVEKRCSKKKYVHHLLYI